MPQEETVHASMRRYDNVNGSDIYGNPVLEIPQEVLDSITRNGVRVLPQVSSMHLSVRYPV